MQYNMFQNKYNMYWNSPQFLKVHLLN
jgi:hypothetical protein